MNQINTYELLSKFREPLIKKIIDNINIAPVSDGIDIGCGIGSITKLLAERISAEGSILGLDYSSEFINHAINHRPKNIKFVQGDINHLELPENSFDWIWSMDTVWAGPEEYGCPAEKPDAILRQFHETLKPGGTVNLLFWSSQKLLPGYPLLEGRLNSSEKANAPYIEDMKHENHILYALNWLRNAGFSDVKAKTFAGDISGPLSEDHKKALAIFFQMFWGSSRNEVSKEDWEQFQSLCIADSENFLPADPDYYGFYTYTLFQGRK